MAKSAKDKVAANLAVDGTPKLAAKAKSSDKHNKPGLNIEEATVASPRSSRKRAGEYFDFDPDTVADEDAGAEGKTSTKAGASKEDQPSKKAKTGTESTAKKGGKKSKVGNDAADADDGEILEDRVVADDAKKPKGKKAATAKKDVITDSSGDAAAVPADKDTSAKKGKAKKADGNKADAPGEKKGKAKKADAAKGDTADVKKPKSKKADTPKEAAADTKKAKGKKVDEKGAAAADDGETLEDRVVAKDAKKSKGKKADTAEHEVVVGPSGDTAEVPDEPKTKKPKATKARADGAKASEKDTKTPAAKDKPESSKASKRADNGSAADADSKKPKETANKAAPKEKATKTKDAKSSAAAEPKSPAKKSKAKAIKDTPAAVADAAMDQGPFENLLNTTDKGTTSVHENTKAAKAPKPKKDAKKPAKEAAADKPAKKAKDAEAAAKPKKAGKAKTNKPDIPDQAVQPMDLVEEEAAINALSKPEASASKGKKRKATSDAAAESVKSNLLDPLSNVAEESANKKQKKSRKSLGESLGEVLATGADAVRHSLGGLLGGGADGKPTTTTGSSKKSKGKGKATDTAQPPANEAPKDEDDEEDDDEEPSDQTAALLAGFESEGDDAHPPGDAGFKEGAKIPSLPDSKATTKKLKAIKSAEKDTLGVVYVGRIPHGFYEHEMRTYFSQFGDINRLRLSRSRKTGHSKHIRIPRVQKRGCGEDRGRDHG